MEIFQNTPLLFLCFAGLFSSFIDAIAGGGGLISIPAFIFFGLPIHQALGTNKLAASCSSITSSWQYIRSKKIDFSPIYPLIPFTILGAIIGVNLTVRLSSDFLHLLFGWLILAITLYTLFSKDNGCLKDSPKGKISYWILVGFSLFLGFYDGFFGPGTGSFLLFGFRKLLKEDYLLASGHSKLLNFTSNIVSLGLFAYHGKILYGIGLLVGFFMVLGAYIGSKLALKKGNLLIKPVFVLISASLGIKLILDYFLT
ncbi:MAG: TSUP family transporter [Caldisericia bacterium]|nr:TSUP family transporter [Caldisericia bacterium]